MIKAWIRCIFFLINSGHAIAAIQTIGIYPPPNGDSIAWDMNPAGQVAAVIQDENGDQHAIFFDRNASIQIGTLGGRESESRRINTKGEIIGSANRTDGSWAAFLYSRGIGLHDLGTLGGVSSHGMAINDRGEAVGYSDLANHEWHAFIYRRDGKLKDLGTLGGKISYASAVNNQGQVVGAATLENGYRHAFIYDSVHGMIDLGTLGGRSSYAASINDKGIVVGSSETKDRDWHAFMFDGRRMIDLGASLGQWDTFAAAINNDGYVVGIAKLNSERQSFVWHDGSVVMHRCDSRGLYLINSISETGLVIGATFRQNLTAATMLASAPTDPVDNGVLSHSDIYLMSRIFFLLLATGALVICRRRYQGLSFRP
ncbi:putative HAF family extracellular repeat protein [Oxalobacteraceae bacterium GrIS 2.11]